MSIDFDQTSRRGAVIVCFPRPCRYRFLEAAASFIPAVQGRGPGSLAARIERGAAVCPSALPFLPATVLFAASPATTVPLSLLSSPRPAQ